MAVYKPTGRAITKASASGADVFKLTLTVHQSFSLVVITGSASVTGALWVWDNSTSSGTLHKTYTQANKKYAVTCKAGMPHVYRFIRG